MACVLIELEKKNRSLCWFPIRALRFDVINPLEWFALMFRNVSKCRKSLRFWNAAFFDAVHSEREIPAIPRFVNFQLDMHLELK